MSILLNKPNGVNGRPGLATVQPLFNAATKLRQKDSLFGAGEYRFATGERERQVNGEYDAHINEVYRRHANGELIESRQVDLTTNASAALEASENDLPAIFTPPSTALQKAGAAAFYSGQSLLGHEIEGLWNEILLLRRQNKAQVIGLASAQSGEGTSTILANLALEIKEFDWPVLLVDLNVAHPHLAELFSCAPAPGFVDLLERRCKFFSASRPIIANKLYLLPLGHVENAGGVNWETTARALYMLKEYFGLILVDLPPLSENPQALHLTCATDGVIQIVQAENTRLESLKAVKQQLDRLNVRLFGSVLNRRQFHIPKFLYKSV